MPDAVSTVIESLKKSPQLLVTFLIVALFLMYMDKRDRIEVDKVTKVDLVAKQRIEQCHATQERATKALEKLEETLRNQSLAYQELSIAVRSASRLSEANAKRIEEALEERRERQ